MAQRLDREAGLSRLDDLRVKATDTAGLVSSLSFQVDVDDVNDNRPLFDNDVYTVNVTSSTSSSK